LENAAIWYAAAQDGLGLRFYNAIVRTVEGIMARPFRWPIRQDNIRRALVKGFPYGIFYEVRETKIIVVAVAHLHRRSGYWRGRRTK
jgi:hypothetical protein